MQQNKPGDEARTYTCDMCGKAGPLNLYILGYTVCAQCERRILTAKVGDRTYQRIRKLVGDTLAAAHQASRPS